MVQSRLALVLGLSLAVLGCSSRGAPTGALGSVAARIVGGTPDTTTKGIVAVTWYQEGICSGTLITPNLVLTARHCVVEAILNEDDGSIDCSETSFGPLEPARSMHVTTEDDITYGPNPAGLYATQEILVPNDPSFCGNDLALMILKDGGIPSALATPIEPRLASRAETGDTFTAAGYGIQDPEDENASTYGQRMRFDGATLYCEGSGCIGGLFGEGELAGSSPTCSGDSGGPAIDSDGRVMGALSRGDEECSFGIYAGTYDFGDFIRSAAGRAAGLAGTAPPDWAKDPDDPDAGVGDAGPEPEPVDAGVEDSGSDEDAEAPRDAGPRGPTVDALGTSCAGTCPGDYACYSTDGDPPGICVPRCTNDEACPGGYQCSERLSACIPIDTQDREVEGCSIETTRPHRDPSRSAAFFGLGLLAALRRRRKC